MSQDVSRNGSGPEDDEFTVSRSDLPLIQSALHAYAAGLRRQARSRALRGGNLRTAREETRKEAARAAVLASQIGRR